MVYIIGDFDSDAAEYRLHRNSFPNVQAFENFDFSFVAALKNLPISIREILDDVTNRLHFAFVTNRSKH